MNWEEISGALARGYCTKENEEKELDATLLLAMVEELKPVIRSLLKEQRENCQQNYKIESMDRNLPISARVSQAIANAPEPKGIK